MHPPVANYSLYSRQNTPGKLSRQSSEEYKSGTWLRPSVDVTPYHSALDPLDRYRTRLARFPHSARTAFPARSPPLPAAGRSLRAASVFLTSPPPQGDPRARSGTLRLYCTTSRGTNPETHWGKPGTPAPEPRPRNPGPVPGFLPDPHSCLPSTTVLTARMTEEGSDTTGGPHPRPRNSASCPPHPTNAEGSTLKHESAPLQTSPGA